MKNSGSCYLGFRDTGESIGKEHEKDIETATVRGILGGNSSCIIHPKGSLLGKTLGNVLNYHLDRYAHPGPLEQ